MSKYDIGQAMRISNYRVSRYKKGWKQVNVWVPTAEDAEEIKRIAAEMRDKAVTMEKLYVPDTSRV